MTSLNLKSRLGFEPLEDRALAASGLSSTLGSIPTITPVTATLSMGVLRVEGNLYANTINVKQANGVITVSGVAGYFPAAAVNKIDIYGYGNNDVIRLNSETMGGQPIMKPCTVHGGVGNDTIFGGYGNDQLFGDAGDDVIFGGPGADYLVGGLGKDKLYGGAGSDHLVGDTADVSLAGQAGSDVIAFEKFDPAPLVNSNEAALKTVLQMGIGDYSFSKSKDGEKITVKDLVVQDVTIENGITRVHLKADIRYQKTRGLTQFSTSGTIKFSVQPQLNATFTEGQVYSASAKMANVNVKEVNLSNVPNWLDNSSEMKNFLEAKLEAQAPIDLTTMLNSFVVLGGSLGPTIGA